MNQRLRKKIKGEGPKRRGRYDWRNDKGYSVLVRVESGNATDDRDVKRIEGSLETDL